MIHAMAMNGQQCVLHPTDFSGASQPAFAVALETARRHDAELILVHVLEPKPALDEEADIAGRQAAEVAARKGFDSLLEVARKQGVRASDVLTDGVPPIEIARLAKERRVNLVVMGTHGRTATSNVYRGTVAEGVIATAPCWVVTVRG